MSNATHSDDTTARNAAAQNGVSLDFKSSAETFAENLAGKLSIHLGTEVSVKLTSLENISCRQWTQSWTGPSHFTMFKMEPLRGLCILEMSAFLSLGLVDKLMGGPGQMPETAHELGEIERLVLEPVIELMLQEWCGRWAKSQQLKPVILGHESNGRFIPIGAPETMMLVLGLEAAFGQCVGAVQIAFPFTVVQPLSARKNNRHEATKADAPATATACQWNDCFNEVPLALKVEWPAVEMSAREVLTLKVGDVLPMDPQSAQQVEIRLADQPKFLGRPGSIAGQWAVELTQVIKQ